MRGTVRAWVETLFAAALHGRHGIIRTPTGLMHAMPNPAAQWPPHRRVGTPARLRRGAHTKKLIKVCP